MCTRPNPTSYHNSLPFFLLLLFLRFFGSVDVRETSVGPSPARSVCLVTLSLSEAGPGRFGRQVSVTDIYHTIPYHTAITERPRAPSGVAVFMSAHSKTPYITPSMDFYSGKGVVRGRRGQQLEDALPYQYNVKSPCLIMQNRPGSCEPKLSVC